MTTRVMFYVQHLLGIGHVRRASLICRAMVNQGLDVLVVLGGRDAPGISFKPAKIKKLPPAHVADHTFTPLLQQNGTPVDATWKDSRRQILQDCFSTFQPDILMIEMFPFGRRQFRFELLPLLEMAKHSTLPPLVVSSVRDILVTNSKPGRTQETVTCLHDYFDWVLVHGDPGFCSFSDSFKDTQHIESKIRYTGYVAPPLREHAKINVGHDEVIVSAGGGAVGGPLFHAAMAARPLSKLADKTWRFVTGPHLGDEDFQVLLKQASKTVIVERFRSDLPDMFTHSALSISQGGYNTIMDLLQAKATAIVVPYEDGKESEQRRRAELMHEQHLIHLFDTQYLSPNALAKAIDRATPPRTKSKKIDLSGAETTARLLCELTKKKPQPGSKAADLHARAPWKALSQELDIWQDMGLLASFWWRDDDAIGPTDALEKILAIAHRNQVPLSVAVIPSLVIPELATQLNNHPDVTVLQHGFAHINHAQNHEKKSEFGEHRTINSQIDDVSNGIGIMRIFSHAQPIFVPPWNRISDAMVKTLPRIGFMGLSTFRTQHKSSSVPGLAVINTHIDVIDWKNTRRFVGTDTAIADAVDHLKAKRLGTANKQSPTGLLTHHLVHDEDCNQFLGDFFAHLNAHAGAEIIPIYKAVAS